MTPTDPRLRIHDILDPLQCLRCGSAHVANVLFTDGETRKMFYCSRLDCDNWCTETVEGSQESFREEDSEAA